MKLESASSRCAWRLVARRAICSQRAGDAVQRPGVMAFTAAKRRQRRALHRRAEFTPQLSRSGRSRPGRSQTGCFPRLRAPAARRPAANRSEPAFARAFQRIADDQARTSNSALQLGRQPFVRRSRTLHAIAISPGLCVRSFPMPSTRAPKHRQKGGGSVSSSPETAGFPQ